MKWLLWGTTQSRNLLWGEFLSDSDDYFPNEESESDLEADLDLELEPDGTNNNENESGMTL